MAIFYVIHNNSINTKMVNTYPDTFEQKVGFDRLENSVAKCRCPLGAAKVTAAEFLYNFESMKDG
jgi:hypothetical protein